MKKYNGFTLSEMILTLSICAIIAVITLPHLFFSRENMTHQAQLKKAYIVLSDYAQAFQADHKKSVPDWITENGIAAFHNEFSDNQGTSQFTKIQWNSSGGYTKPIEYRLLNTQETTTYLPCDNSIWWKDRAGDIIAFDDAPEAGYNGPRICVDTNGTKGPNTFGVDFFTFLFTVDGDVIPEGQEHEKNNYKSTDVLNKAYTLKGGQNCYNQTEANYGVTCAYYAINDISPMDSTQQYWRDFIGKRQYQN